MPGATHPTTNWWRHLRHSRARFRGGRCPLGGLRTNAPAAGPVPPAGLSPPQRADRLCFRGLLIRLVTGSSWVDIEAILDHQISDTTLRARRDEWIAAGLFERLKDEALAAFDRIFGLDMDNLAIDGAPGCAGCGFRRPRAAGPRCGPRDARSPGVGCVSHPGFGAVLIPWPSGCGARRLPLWDVHRSTRRSCVVERSLR